MSAFWFELLFLVQESYYKLWICLWTYFLSIPPLRKFLEEGHLEILSIVMQPPNNPTVQVLSHSCSNTSRGIIKVIYILPSFIPLKKTLYRMHMEYHILMLMAKTQPQVMKAGDGGWTLSPLASQWNNPCQVPSSLMRLSQVPTAVTLHDPACLSLSLSWSSPRLPGIASQINCRHPHPHLRVCFSREQV